MSSDEVSGSVGKTARAYSASASPRADGRACVGDVSSATFPAAGNMGPH